VRKILFHYFFVFSLLLVVSGCDWWWPAPMPNTHEGGFDPDAAKGIDDEQEPGERQDVAGSDDDQDLGPRMDVAGGFPEDPPLYGQFRDLLLLRDSTSIGGEKNGGRVPVQMEIIRVYTDRALDRAFDHFEELATALGGCPHCGSSSPERGAAHGCGLCDSYLGARYDDCRECATDLAEYMNSGRVNDFFVIGRSNNFDNWPDLIGPKYIVEDRNYLIGRRIDTSPLEDRNYLIGRRIDTSPLDGWRVQDREYDTLKNSRKQELLQDAKTLPADENSSAPRYNPLEKTVRKQELMEEIKKDVSSTGNSATGDHRQKLLDEVNKTTSSGNPAAIGNSKQEQLERSKSSSFNTKNSIEEKSYKNRGGEVNSRSMGNKVISQPGTSKTFVPQGGKTQTFTRQPTTGRSPPF
jgi:hypothetical protein